MSEGTSAAAAAPSGSAVGFTGVDWETRRPERLRADLAAGAGPGPLHACAQDWADLAVELDRLVAATKRTVTALREEWDSPGALAAAGVLARMPVWLDALAHRGRHQADLVVGAAAAAQTAHLAMPAAAEIDRVRGQLTELAGSTGLSAVMTGGMARAERAQTEIAATAARVMHAYERDCTAVATAPSQRTPAPVLVRGTPLAPGSSAAAAGAAGVGPGAIAGLGAAAPRVLGRFIAAPVATARPRDERRKDLTTPRVEAGGNTGAERGSSMGPVAPMAGAAGGGPARAVATDPVVAGAAEQSFAVAETTEVDAAEPMTWAQLAAHDQVRATPGPAATDPGRTTV